MKMKAKKKSRIDKKRAKLARKCWCRDASCLRTELWREIWSLHQRKKAGATEEDLKKLKKLVKKQCCPSYEIQRIAAKKWGDGVKCSFM